MQKGFLKLETFHTGMKLQLLPFSFMAIDNKVGFLNSVFHLEEVVTIATLLLAPGQVPEVIEDSVYFDDSFIGVHARNTWWSNCEFVSFDAL